MEEEIFSEKCGKKSQVKQGLKYEFGNLSVNSNLGKDDFSGTVSVEARLSWREIKVKKMEILKHTC